MRTLLPLFLLVTLTSCFKTAEDIAREKKVDEMSVQLEQSQRLVADLTTQVQMLQTQLATYTGRMEEQTNEQKQQQESRLKTWQELSAQMDAINKLSGEQEKEMRAIKKELEDQKKYLEKVLKTLKSVKSQGPSLKKAHSLFEKNKLAAAKAEYLDVLEAGKISAGQKNAVRYNLGLISYWTKKYEDAISYFSQIYTKWPKSSYADRSLYYIGLSFKKSGDKESANEAFKQLMANYPKSKYADKSKKELK
jgi:TolA-binding protein